MKKLITKNKKSRKEVVLEILQASEKGSDAYMFLHLISEPVFAFKIMLALYKNGVVTEEDFFLKGDVLEYEEIIKLDDNDNIILAEVASHTLKEFKLVESYTKKDPLTALLLIFNPEMLDIIMSETPDKNKFDSIGQKTMESIKNILSEILVINSIKEIEPLNTKLIELKAKERTAE